MINCSHLPNESLAFRSQREAKLSIHDIPPVLSDMYVQRAKSDFELHDDLSLFDEKMAEFAAGIGHELNNPLASIGGRVQLLMQTITDENIKKDLAQIYSEVKRAGDLISDIRLYACPPEPILEIVDLSKILQSVIDSFSAQDVLHDIHLQLAVSPTPAIIQADASQMDVLFRAIIRNSIETLENDYKLEKRLSISLIQYSDEIEVIIADNGPGLTEFQKKHAFAPYYSARQANRGLGFGLCKAERIVQLHKAIIQIESVLNTGTLVRVRFRKA